MSYVEQVLNQDEKIIKVAKLSPLAFIPDAIAAFVFVIAGFFVPYFFLLAVVLIAKAFVAFISTELALTDKKLVAKFGFIRRDVIELRLGKIESISVSQGIFGRILNFGTVIVRSAGSRAPIPYISAPMEFRKEVDNHLQALER